MSLILEALRKSEAERRRGQAPGVAVELPPPTIPGRVNVRRWLWPVLALVVLFALVPVLAIWWMARDSWVPDDAPAQPEVAAPPLLVAPDIAPAVVPRTPPATQVPARSPAPAPAIIPAVPAPAPAATPREEVPVATSPPGAAVPPPASDPAPALGMSGVRLSMHLWNEDPARRFVVLNGQRMMEGERIGNITLVEILRDGVIVERDGQQARIDLP